MESGPFEFVRLMKGTMIGGSYCNRIATVSFHRHTNLM